MEVISAGLDSMLANHYPKDKMILILASEERAGEEGQKIAGQIKTKYENRFLKFFLTVHPDGLEGEIKGKSANASYAIKQILSELAKLNITTEQVLISNFDSTP